MADNADFADARYDDVVHGAKTLPDFPNRYPRETKQSTDYKGFFWVAVVAALLLLAGFLGESVLENNLPPKPAVAEDDAGWNCQTQGNLVCGEVGLIPPANIER